MRHRGFRGLAPILKRRRILIYDVLRGSGREGFQICRERIQEVAAGGAGGPGLVRGDQAIRSSEERVIFRGRLDRKHIEASAGDLLRLQGIREVLLEYERSAAGV